MKEGAVIQPRRLQLNLDSINRLPHTKYLEKKIGECGGVRNSRVPITERPSSIEMHGIRRGPEYLKEIADAYRNVLLQSPVDSVNRTIIKFPYALLFANF